MRYGWAMVFLMAALSVTSCTLDRRALGVPRFYWSCTAVVRSSDGVTTSLSSDDAGFTNGYPMETYAAPGEAPDAAEARMRDQWRRLLHQQLAFGALPLTVVARLGAPPYCLVSDDLMRTGTFFTSTDPGPLLADEISPCPTPPPAPPTCGNDASAHPVLSLSPPDGFDFGPLSVGSPEHITVHYINSGDGRLCLAAPMIDLLSSPNPHDFTVDASDCMPTNAAETMDGMLVLSATTRLACNLVVQFNPQDPGPRQGEVRATSNDPGMPMSLFTVTGNGVAGELLPLPASLCFNVPAVIDPMLSGPQHERLMTLTNSGPGVVTVASLTTPAADGGWSVRAADATGAILRPPFPVRAGGTVTVTISAVDGTVVNSTLTIASNASLTHQEIALQGPTSGCTP